MVVERDTTNSKTFEYRNVFFLTNFNICTAMNDANEGFPIKRSAVPEGQIVNIRCTFKIMSPRNSEGQAISEIS